jgi:hypothetical protein
MRGGTLNIPLLGFDFKVTGGATATTGMASGKHGSFELMIRFEPGPAYGTFLEMTETNEVLKSCRLTDGSGGGMAAKDNWTQMAAPAKGTNKGNAAPPAPSGAMVWTLTNATVTSVLAVGNENNAGVAAGSVQATLTAERFEFAMQ